MNTAFAAEGAPAATRLLRPLAILALLLAVLIGGGATTSAMAPLPPAVLNTNAATDSGDDCWPQVTTDGAGNWVAVWDSYDDLGGTINGNRDILFARSTDDGATWTAPAALNTNAATDLGGDWYPEVTTDEAGNWVAVWSSDENLGGTIGTDRDILVARSTDNGATWTAPAALNTNAATDSGEDHLPQVTTDGGGNWVAAWDSSENLGGTIGTDPDILVARSTDNGATWTAPAALNTNAATDSGGDHEPQVTTDGGGNWVAAWESSENLGGTIGTDPDILVARSTDNGAAWTAPAALNTNAATDTGNDDAAQVTTDGAGKWVAVWRSTENLGGTIGTDRDILVARSADNGATWTAPAVLNTNAATDSEGDIQPQVTTDDAGNWVAVWHTPENLGGTIGADYDILVSHSTDNGATWTAPAALNTNAATDSGDDWNPQVTTDGAGNWVAVWRSSENLGGTIGTDDDILYTAFVMGPPGVLNTNAAADSGSDRRSQVATDGAGNWVAVWYSSDSLGGTIGGDEDILVSRSTDNGAAWTAPAALNTNATTDSGADYSPQVTSDGAGNWVAVWRSDENLGGTIGTDHDILVARSTDNGATWTAPAALNTNAATDSGDDNYPQVTTDDGENWVTVWDSTENLGGSIGTDGDILVSRSTDDGATWTAPAAVNTNAATDSGWDQEPQVTTDGAGNWAAVWYSFENLGGTIGTDTDILVSRSTDNGATWTAPAALNTNAASDSGQDARPQVTSDGGGNWVAVWDSGDDLGGTIGTDWDIVVSRSTDNGATWTAPAALNTNAATDSGHDQYSQVTTDGGGNWVAVWHSGENLGGTIGTDWDIVVSRSTDNGATWTAPAALNTNAATDSGHDYSPQVTTDNGGNWVAVWDSDDTLGGTIGSDYDILYTTFVMGPPGVLNTNAAADLGDDHVPQVTTDGAGNWVAVWSSVENLGGTIGSDYDILVARSTDSGATWTAPAALNTNAATDSGTDYAPQVTTDGAGNWVAVWYTNDDLGGTIGTDDDVLVSRSTDNGATWTAPAALNSNAGTDTGGDSWAHVTTDGAGNWVAVWYSDENLGGTIGTDEDILVARSTDNGATWTAPAALNTNASADSGADQLARLTTDGAGNWVALWSSNDTLSGAIGPDYDILVSRSTDNGATWTAPAALNTNAASDSGHDYVPQVMTDGAGNWLAVWQSADDLSGTIGTDYDILVSRSTDNGATWTTPAALNTNAGSDTGGDHSPQVTTDGGGAWMAAWYSYDSLGGTIGTDSDILVSRSIGTGTTWSAPAALNTNAAADSGNDYRPQVTADGGSNWVAVWYSDDNLGGTIGTDSDILYAAFALHVVDSTGDGGDSNTGDGVCDDGGGNCTLRAAVEQASANAGADTIVFDPTIFLPIDPPTITIGASLTLSGDDDTVDASDTGVRVSGAPGFSCFYITGDGNTVKGIDLITGCDHGIVIGNGADNAIGGAAADQRNVISGNSGDGVRITGSGATGNTVSGNFIGTDVTGTADLGNTGNGVFISAAPNNTIGGTTAGAGNVISGNNLTGVSMMVGGGGNQVQGNYIGTDVSGTADLGNSEYGVYIDAVPNNAIGGTTAEARNVISGNDWDGIYMVLSGATGNTVWGNYIGTNAAGTGAIANGDNGVQIDTGALGNIIGGTLASARNVISGNSGDGVEIKDSGTTGNTVEGNYIGTNKNGDSAVANGGNGVLIENGASGNTIGGIPAEGGNVISGNTSNGVKISGSGTTGNTVSANYIGTSAAGTAALPNGSDGVQIIGGAQNNSIGGTATGEGNTIAFNTHNGVCVIDDASDGNSIRGNSIHSNTLLGINLVPLVEEPCGTGVITANDPGDGDTGPNNLMNFPVITDVTYDGVYTTISGTIDTLLGTVTIDIYASPAADGSGYGEGQVYLGSTTTTITVPPEPWTFTMSGFPAYATFTATATAANPSTSEFSSAFTPSAGSPLPATAIARQGQGTPIGGTFATFGDVAVPNVTGDVAFWATVSAGSAPQAIFLKPSGGSITKVVAVGDATPLGGTFSALGQPPLMNASGDIVFWGQVDGTTEGIFRWDGSLTKIAAVGDPTPVGGTYGSFSAPIGTAVPVINNDGDIAFWGTVSGVSGVTEVISLYSAATASLSKVAAVDDSTPLGGTFSTFVSGSWGRATVPVVNNNGQVSFWGAIAGGTASQAIFVKPSGGSIAKIAAAGESTPLGGTYAQFFVIPIPNDSGDVTFWAILSGSSAGVCTTYVAECAVFQVSGGVTTKVVAAGDTGPAGVGGTVTDIGVVPLMNGARQVTVWTAISSGFASEAMIRYTDGVLDNVAAVGNTTPIGGTYSDFALGIPGGIPGINNLGQVAFRGDVSGGSGTEGIFLTDPPSSVVVEEVATAGSEAPDTGGGTLDNNFDLDINGPGEAVFHNTVSGGTSDEGIFRFFSGSALEAVAVAGDPAPTGGDFDTFGPPVNNDAGYIVATAETTAGDVGLFRFFAGSATKLAVDGELAPGITPERFFSGFADPTINNAGDVIAVVTLDNGWEALYRFFAGSPGLTPQLLAVQTDVAPGLGGLEFKNFFQPAVGDGGVVAARVTLNDDTQAMYRFFTGESVGTAELLAHETDQAPDIISPARFFTGFGERAGVNLAGDVTYRAMLDGSGTPQAIFRFFAGSSVTHLLALQGDGIPTAVGGEFGAFGDPAINVYGQVVVRAAITNGGADEGLFLFFMGSPGSPVDTTEIVLEGQTTPDGADTYGGVSPVFPHIAYSDTARIVYVANLVGGSQGVYIASLDTDAGGPDGVLDFLDNCPGVVNTDQMNTDKALAAAGSLIGVSVVAWDELGNPCDIEDDGDSLASTQTPGAAATLCPGGSVPIWADCVEVYLGVNPVDNCNDSPGEDAWPPDIDKNNTVTGGDVFAIFPFWLGSSPRHDLDASGTVTGGDVFIVFPWWLMSCS